MLFTIEHDLDANRYRPGPWAHFVSLVQQRRQADRRMLAGDITRVSEKLHCRHGRRTWSMPLGVGLELVATALGSGLLIIGLRTASNIAVLAAAVIWITTFEPLVKITVGSLLGVRYDYGYMYGIEPRFKMRYGAYLAVSCAIRVVLHLSGTIGSPLAAWLICHLAHTALPLAALICDLMFWLISGFNAMLFIRALLGWQHLGSLKLDSTSGGAAGSELRRALHARRQQAADDMGNGRSANL